MKYISRRKKCYSVFVALFPIIIWIIIISFKTNNNTNEKSIVNSHIMNKNIVTNIKINGILGSYDKEEGSIYFSSDSFNFKNIKVISPYKVKHVIKKNNDKHYSIFVYSSKYYYQYEIYLVNIPLINIYSFDIFNNKNCNIELEECPIGITINDYRNNNRNSSYSILNSYGRMKIRGTTSKMFQKKPYKIIVDKKTQLFNLSADNDWVLDALYSDPSKIRNKLSSDIWNKINDNQTINNDLGTKFVELFIDNQYKGLYAIKNNVDKHVTAIGDTGLLIKASNHFTYDYVEQLKNKDFQIDEEGAFLNMEIKRYNSAIFENFINKMYDYHINNNTFESFDEKNYLNYKVLIALISGDDNVTKNLYYSMSGSDEKILITPWDMDMTWGLIFDPNTSTSSIDDMNSYNDEYRMKKDVIYDLSADAYKKLKDRYWELRKDIISIETINSYLDEYEKILLNSGAAKRDSRIWYDYDVEQEIDNIREWAKRRINYLDTYFMD